MFRITLGIGILLAVAPAAIGQHVASRPSAGQTATPGAAMSAASGPSGAISPPTTKQPLRMSRSPASGGERSGSISPLPSLVTTGVSLALVLSIFLAAAWALRRSLPRGARLLPAEVLEVLGRTPLAGRQHAHLVRCGNKLLLLAVSPVGAETLTEITDPIEVDRLAGLCRQADPQSTTQTFRQVFEHLGRGKASPGFIGSNRASLATDALDETLGREEADG